MPHHDDIQRLLLSQHDVRGSHNRSRKQVLEHAIDDLTVTFITFRRRLDEKQHDLKLIEESGLDAQPLIDLVRDMRLTFVHLASDLTGLQDELQQSCCPDCEGEGTVDAENEDELTLVEGDE